MPLSFPCLKRHKLYLALASGFLNLNFLESGVNIPEKYDYIDRIAEALHKLLDKTKIHNIREVMKDFDNEYREKAADFVDYVNINVSVH